MESEADTREFDLRITVARAALCCMEILRRAELLQERDISNLDVHIGVDVGDNKLVMAGGVDNQWVTILVGEPCRNSFRVDGYGGPHDCMITNEALAYLTAYMDSRRGAFGIKHEDVSGHGNVQRLTAFRLQSLFNPDAKRLVGARNFPIPTAPHVLEPYVPPLSLLVMGNSSVQNVVTLFATLNTAETPTLEEIQMFVVALQTVLVAHQAGLRQIVVDDKGGRNWHMCARVRSSVSILSACVLTSRHV